MFDGADWTTILVAAITGTTAAIGPVIMGAWTRRNEKKSVRAAILAEVSALAEIVRDRDYIGTLEKMERDLSLRRQCAPFAEDSVEGYSLQVVVPPDYNLMYRANSEKLGALKPLEATRVVYFYQLIQSVAVDMGPGGAAHDGTNDPAVFRESRLMLEKALLIADQLRQ